MINLLPISEKKNIKYESISRMISFYGSLVVFELIVAVAILVIFEIFISSEVDRLQQDAMFALKDNQARRVMDLESGVRSFNRDVIEVYRVYQNQILWSQFLINLGDILPDEVKIKAFTMDMATNKVKIAGFAPLREHVIQVKKNIDKSPLYSDIVFPISNIEPEKDINFTIEFTVLNMNKFKRSL